MTNTTEPKIQSVDYMDADGSYVVTLADGSPYHTTPGDIYWGEAQGLAAALPEPPPARPAPPTFVPRASQMGQRTCARNAWNTYLAGQNKLDPWCKLWSDASVLALDRLYGQYGGDAGVYSEDSRRMQRLCAKAGIDLAATMTAVLAG